MADKPCIKAIAVPSPVTLRIEPTYPAVHQGAETPPTIRQKPVVGCRTATVKVRGP